MAAVGKQAMLLEAHVHIAQSMHSLTVIQKYLWYYRHKFGTVLIELCD